MIHSGADGLAKLYSSRFEVTVCRIMFSVCTAAVDVENTFVEVEGGVWHIVCAACGGCECGCHRTSCFQRNPPSPPANLVAYLK